MCQLDFVGVLEKTPEQHNRTEHRFFYTKSVADQLPGFGLNVTLIVFFTVWPNQLSEYLPLIVIFMLLTAAGYFYCG